ncbi:MAG: rhodanese-like domain-containing protein [Methyloligellaceae bacterium]
MLKMGFKDLLAQANSLIETVSVRDLDDHMEYNDALLVDIRETQEWEDSGSIPGAIHASRGFLEFYADSDSELHIPELKPDRQIILYCGTGGRSTLAAKTLMDMGFSDVRSLAGGIAAWREAQKSL